MIRFNKVLSFKLVSLIIACIFLLTNIAHGIALSEKTSLRKPLDFNNQNITSRYLGELPAQSNSYEKFQSWLGNISQDKLENTIVFLDVLETFLKGLSDRDWRLWKANSEALKAIIDAGLVTKEEVRKEEKENKLLETLLKGMNDLNEYARKTNSEALKAIIDTDLVTKEEAKENKLLEVLLKDLSDLDLNLHARKATSEALKAIIDTDLVTKEEAKENKLLEVLLKGLSDPDWSVREVNSKALKAIIDAGLVTKEEVSSREEIESIFEEVYGRGFSSLRHFYYYLKFLSILRDNPVAAYQIFDWSLEELSELFQIFDYFVKGAASDPSYKTEGDGRYFLEKRLIKNILIFLKDPQTFISNLKERIRITISDDSIKLAIRVHEIASVNAARGLIKALGLDKDNVIILYEREINSEQAGRFFPGYNIKAYSEFNEKNSIDIWFQDYGNIIINFSNIAFLSATLSYAPFKFNLPKKLSGEEISNMRASLGIGTRKVIVIGSPSDIEFNEFMRSYNLLYGALPHGKRPLIISGFRQRRNESDLKLLSSLSGQSIAVRSDDKTPLPDVKNNNVLILNTSGELLRMYALADVAIIGDDRNIFEPASQEAAVLYFDWGGWRNNKVAKEKLVETGAAEIFSKENLERLLGSHHELEEMAKKGLGAVEAYKKEVLSKAEEFALQIIGARAQLRDKFIASSPVEHLLLSIRNGVLLSQEQTKSLGFNDNRELFSWVNEIVNKNEGLMRRLRRFKRNDSAFSGGQSSLIIDPANPDYALKAVEQNYTDMPVKNTIEAFKLSRERLGGLVTPFFLPSDFDSKHEAVVHLVSSLTDEAIRKKGKVFVDEYLLLIETYWQRGVFDHDFKLDGLGTVGRHKQLIVLDFGLSEDTLNEGLFIAPIKEEERFRNTFNIGIDKLHNTRELLKEISSDISEYFEDQLEKRYKIKLLQRWNRSMRGGDEATELAGKLREAVKRFRPELATPNYVFPFIGGKFDKFILSKIEERFVQHNAISHASLPVTSGALRRLIRNIFGSL